jgi:hypothetical protein
MLNIEDKFAGQMMQCPLCNGTFTAPVLPATPPSAVPLASASASKSNPPAEDVFSLAPSTTPSMPPPRKEPKKEKPSDSTRLVAETPISDQPGADASGPDYPHRYIVWISPRVVPWIAPGALVIAFLFFFFPWRHVAVVGSDEFSTEMGWRVMGKPVLVFYFIMYVIALALAIGSLLLTLKIVPTPPQIGHLIPWKTCIVAGIVAFAFLFLYIGFWTEPLSTSWFRWTVWLHLVALIGLTLEYWLERRGPSLALPRVDVLW